MRTGTQRSRQQKEIWFCKKKRGGVQMLQNMNRNTVWIKFQEIFANSCHRRHIFTITSSVSRAMQCKACKCSNAMARNQSNTGIAIMHLHASLFEQMETCLRHNSTPAAHRGKYRSHGCTTNARSHTSAFNNARVVIIMIIIVTTNRNTTPNVRNTQEHAAWNAVAGYMTRNTEWEPFRNRDAHARISTHAHALWHCNRSSLIISLINEPATEYLKSILHKSGGNSLQNQINKGETTCSAPHSKAFKRPAHQPSIKSQQHNQSAAAPRQAEQANNANRDGA